MKKLGIVFALLLFAAPAFAQDTAADEDTEPPKDLEANADIRDLMETPAAKVNLQR